MSTSPTRPTLSATAPDPIGPPASRLVGPGRLLVSALVPLALFMVGAHFTVVGATSARMSPDQVADRAMPWVLVAVLWVTPVVMAAAAFSRIAVTLAAGTISSPVARTLAATGIVLLVGYVAGQVVLVITVATPEVGDSGIFAAAVLLSLLGWWLVDVVALLGCWTLVRARIMRRTALVVGVLTALALLLEVAIYFPALVGDAQLRDTVGLPPMLLPVLWALLGWRLWRASRRSS